MNILKGIGIVVDKIKYGIIKAAKAIKMFFEKALGFLKKVFNKLSSRIKGLIQGMKHAYRFTKDGKIKQVSNVYSQNQETKEWEETVVTETITKEEVPPEYEKKYEEEYEINKGIFREDIQYDNTDALDNAITM